VQGKIFRSQNDLDAEAFKQVYVAGEPRGRVVSRRPVWAETGVESLIYLIDILIEDPSGTRVLRARVPALKAG
jgi:hypothetical protein